MPIVPHFDPGVNVAVIICGVINIENAGLAVGAEKRVLGYRGSQVGRDGVEQEAGPKSSGIERDGRHAETGHTRFRTRFSREWSIVRFVRKLHRGPSATSCRRETERGRMSDGATAATQGRAVKACATQSPAQSIPGHIVDGLVVVGKEM